MFPALPTLIRTSLMKDLKCKRNKKEIQICIFGFFVPSWVWRSWIYFFSQYFPKVTCLLKQNVTLQSLWFTYMIGYRTGLEFLLFYCSVLFYSILFSHSGSTYEHKPFRYANITSLFSWEKSCSYFSFFLEFAYVL